MKYCFLVLMCYLLLVSCSHSPPRPRQPKVPDGTKLAVIMFQDCTIRGQDDCDGSGETAGMIFASVLDDKPALYAVPLSRPVGPKDQLSDASAIAYAKSKGYAYVVNGEVEDFYRVAPMTFRRERAGVSVRVLRTADGQVINFYTDHDTSNNLSSPESLIKDMAEDVRDALEDN